uniref:Uncharacterized protein n=1 Tax=Anguilla anguilla TaxID=7936 RepID=A0A0E9S9Q1_ANGAN
MALSPTGKSLNNWSHSSIRASQSRTRMKERATRMCFSCVGMQECSRCWGYSSGQQGE